MMRTTLAVLMLLVVTAGAAEDTWYDNKQIVDGIGDIGSEAFPNVVFTGDPANSLLVGNESGMFTGYNWTGTTWQSDTAIVSGLVDVGYNSASTTFSIGSTLYLITGANDGTFTGYNWIGTTWQSDSGIVSGLGDVGTDSAPTTFYMGNTLYLISGTQNGGFKGFDWTGTTWQSNSTIVNGIQWGGESTSNSGAAVFVKNGINYLIRGRSSGACYGYNWTGTTWQRDYVINTGLGDITSSVKPHAFHRDATLYLLIGNRTGWVTGFDLTGGSPTNLTHTKGMFWVNHTWGTCVGTLADSYNVSINETWHNGTTNTYYNNTLTTYGDWSNITVYAYNNTQGLSAGSVSEDVQLPFSIPAVPVGAGSTWDYYWVNHTWTEGGSYGMWCGDTDSYNVSINETWYNGTTNTYYNNTGLPAHGWSNASIYAFNETAGTNETYIYQNVQMVNRAITITNTGDWSGMAGAKVYVNYDATDPDGDTPVFSCNRTDLFTDFSTSTGTGNWTAATGTYYVDFGVSDGHGSTDNYTMVLTAFSSTSPVPTNLTYTTGCHWVHHTWQAGSGVVTDSYNVSVNSVWHNGTTDLFYNETGMSPIGWSNISVYAFNDSVGMISDMGAEQTVQIPRCGCSFMFYDPFHYYGVHEKKVASFSENVGGWLPCDDNAYVWSSCGVNFYSTGAEDNVVYGGWDVFVEDCTCCYHDIDATEDCEIIYLHADVLVPNRHGAANVYVGDPSLDNIDIGNPVSELIGFYATEYQGYTIIMLFGASETYPVPVFAGYNEWLSVSLAYDLSTKEYIFLEVVDSTSTYTRYNLATSYTTQSRDLSNVTMRFGVEQIPPYFIHFSYLDNIYVSSMEYAPSSTSVVLRDASGNPITNAQVAVYDTTTNTYTQKWENDADGVINISAGADVEVQIAVRSFDGVFSRHFSANETRETIDWTIPIKYNVDVYPKEQTGEPIFDVFCGLSEYTPLNPQAFWGFSMTGSRYVPITNCSGFAMCDIIAEKGGYRDYNVTALNWTSRSALIKDYRHTAVMEANE